MVPGTWSPDCRTWKCQEDILDVILVYRKAEGSLHRLYRLCAGASQLHGSFKMHGAYYAAGVMLLMLTCITVVPVRRNGLCVGDPRLRAFSHWPDLGFSLRRGFDTHYESFWLFPIQVRREGLSRGGCMLQPAGCYLTHDLGPGMA